MKKLLASKEKPTPQPKPAKKEKTKSGGLFGFGKKKPKPRDEEEYESYNDDDDDVEYESPQTSQPIPQPVQQPRKPTARQPKQQTVEAPQQKLMSKETAQDIYGGVKFEKVVFLYAPNTIWGSIHRIVNSYDGINCIGTSDVNAITQEYRKNNLVDTIFLFLQNKNEVEPIANFLANINLSALDSSLLTIKIIKDESISDINAIKNVDGIANFAKVIKSKGSITEVFINQILATVVKTQPAYPSLNRAKKPEPSKLLVRTDSGLKVDFTKLTKFLDEAKKNSADEELKQSIKTAIATSVDAGKTLDGLGTHSKSIKILQSLDDELDTAIKHLRNKPNARREIEQLISNKLVLSSLTAKEVRDIVTDVVKEAQKNISEHQEAIETFDSSALAELDTMHMERNELLEERNKLRDSVVTRYKAYIQQANLVLNCYKLEEVLCSRLNNKMVSLEQSGIVPDSDNLQGALTTFKNSMRSLKEDAEKASHNTKTELARAFRLASSILQDAHQLIEVDDFLINTLQKEIEAMAGTRVQVVKTETRLGERLVLTYILPNSSPRKVFQYGCSPSDLIVSVGDTGNESTFANIGEKIITAERFLNMNPEEFRTLSSITEIQVDRNFDRTESMINTLDLIAKYFDKIFVIVKLRNTDNAERYSMEEAFKKAAVRVVFWTTPTDAPMILTNRYYTSLQEYNNIKFYKCVFNKFDDNEHKEKVKEYRVAAGFRPDVVFVSVAYLKSSLGSDRAPAQKTIEYLKGKIEAV